MKQTIKSLLAIAMIICMVFTVVGCDDAATGSEPVAAGDDFFTDEITQNEGATQNSDAQSTVSDGKTDKDDKNDKDKDIPTQNKIGGKSWKEVLASMPKKLRGTKLVMYNWNTPTEYTGAPAVMDEFTKQTGIKVEWRTIAYATYFTKLPALVASGENIPDLVRATGPIVEYMIPYEPLQNIKYDFSDEAWDQDIMDLYTFGGKTYATSLKNTHVGGIGIMFYNKALIDEHDFEDPYELWKAGKWNWDKYIEMCREYKDLTGNQGSNGEGNMSRYLNIFGFSGTLKYDGKKFVSNVKDKKFRTTIEELCTLYNEEDLFGFGGEPTFNSGKALFSLGTAIHLRNKNSYFGNLKAAGTLRAIPMPSIPGQDKYYVPWGEAEAYAIAQGAPNSEAAPYFLRYFLDGANYELSTYFGNKQNLEVYNWCMSQKNKIYSYGMPGMGVHADKDKALELATSDQVNTIINSNSNVVDRYVKEYNDTLKKLK